MITGNVAVQSKSFTLENCKNHQQNVFESDE